MLCRACRFYPIESPNDDFPKVGSLLVAPDHCQELYNSVYFCPECGTLRIKVPACGVDRRPDGSVEIVEGSR